jgi:hypothetical protein
MVRLQTVGWIALPSQRPNDPFRIAILLTMFWITINCLIYYMALVLLTKLIFFLAMNSAIYLYFVSNVIRIRLSVRRRYAITTARSNNNNNTVAVVANDTLIGGLVPQLCLMQLLRHTCDYDTLAGFVFTANGVSSQVKLIVPSSSSLLLCEPNHQHYNDSVSTMLSVPLR